MFCWEGFNELWALMESAVQESYITSWTLCCAPVLVHIYIISNFLSSLIREMLARGFQESEVQQSARFYRFKVSGLWCSEKTCEKMWGRLSHIAPWSLDFDFLILLSGNVTQFADTLNIYKHVSFYLRHFLFTYISTFLLFLRMHFLFCVFALHNELVFC